MMNMIYILDPEKLKEENYNMLFMMEQGKTLQKEFLKALPGHQKALEKIPQDIKIEVIEIDRNNLAK